MGVSPAQYGQYGQLTQASGFATNLGEGDLSASSAFMRGILSGDSTKISQVLSPQINAVKTSANQDTKTNTEMGSRSGGTAASNNAAIDKAHSDIANMVATLTGGAASSLAGTGSGLLSAGMSGSQVGFQEASEIQQQKLAKFNDIISSIQAAIAAAGGMPGVGKAGTQALDASAGALG
jgi:hypothetical protein